ncbi:hypothetical protein BEWA_041720 [Theileria equi strain WA]|uniref:Uncharacterized protein n=1 Tax=Theileria equi strain WA TaxID=1537102 RepID=L1LFT1_THEEQ|nr:hypothetical protein BEWA_041720 [Theileria equi strain WA]EKX74134.1 hypothetical protein BEWA_041720 [Theileria equi strain WA]|eukprot:XP_004833586.1 hypothetical protein BEWA_041720 [Theileria equi strain WA]
MGLRGPLLTLDISDVDTTVISEHQSTLDNIVGRSFFPIGGKFVHIKDGDVHIWERESDEFCRMALLYRKEGHTSLLTLYIRNDSGIHYRYYEKVSEWFSVTEESFDDKLNKMKGVEEERKKVDDFSLSRISLDSENQNVNKARGIIRKMEYVDYTPKRGAIITSISEGEEIIWKVEPGERIIYACKYSKGFSEILFIRVYKMTSRSRICFEKQKSWVRITEVQFDKKFASMRDSKDPNNSQILDLTNPDKDKIEALRDVCDGIFVASFYPRIPIKAVVDGAYLIWKGKACSYARLCTDGKKTLLYITLIGVKRDIRCFEKSRLDWMECDCQYFFEKLEALDADIED